MRVRKRKKKVPIRCKRHTKRELFDVWFVNKEAGKIVFVVEYSICRILVALFIDGDCLVRKIIN